MSNIFNKEFREFIDCLNKSDARYILVGGFAVIIHGYSRTTGDMDIWVDRDKENYKKIALAFNEFGMPVFDMTEQNFLEHPHWDVFTFGNPPTAIDLMVKVKGLDFKECFDKSIIIEDDGLKIRVLHKNDLLAAKSATSRPKDLDDLDNLSK